MDILIRSLALIADMVLSTGFSLRNSTQLFDTFSIKKSFRRRVEGWQVRLGLFAVLTPRPKPSSKSSLHFSERSFEWTMGCFRFVFGVRFVVIPRPIPRTARQAPAILPLSVLFSANRKYLPFV